MDYVLVHACYPNEQRLDDVLLIKKNRPDWQKGLFNLVGGKVEDQEEPSDAAVRELKEETGFDPLRDTKPVYYGKIVHDKENIFCYKILIDFVKKIPSNDDEPVAWHRWHKVRNSKNLIPSLKLIIPLITNGIKDWELIDDLSGVITIKV